MDQILASIGWTPAWAAAFAALLRPDLVPGRVVLEHNHVFRVMTADGERLAESAGRLKHRAADRDELPVVGDWVGVQPSNAGDRWTIQVILPRRTSFSRKAAGRNDRVQVLAANVDVALLVTSLERRVRGRRLERYLVLVRQPGVEPVIVLNKRDLCDDPASARDEALQVAGDSRVLVVSASTGEGLGELREIVTGRTSALLGPSGSGKSSLANALIGQSILETGDVRPRDARGRQVSVHRQLVAVPGGGALVDTPGMRELQAWQPADAVAETFPDVARWAADCRFRDCRHEREPGCAVKAAVDAGELSATRVAHYLDLERERDALDRRLMERGQSTGGRQRGGQDNATNPAAHRRHASTRRLS